jgi:hypothetical protein
VTGDQPTEVVSGASVVLGGTGTIVPEGINRVIDIKELMIEENSQIIAKGLTITKRLTMTGKTTLGAISGDYIYIDSNAIVEIYGNEKDLPRLNLGILQKEELPAILKVEPPSGLTAEERATFSHALIVGDPLDNCQEWRDILELKSELFTSECASGAGARRLKSEGSLLIKGVASSQPNPPLPTETVTPSGLGAGAIAGIVIAVVVVVAGVAVGVFFFLRQKGGGSGTDGSGKNVTV